MKKLVVSLALGLGLVAFGASDAKAYCLDFSNFCDCLDVNPVADNAGGAIRRLVGTWVNQDCAATTSAMQGLSADGKNSLAGELLLAPGPGINWNFTWRTCGVFDLDYWDGTDTQKQQNDSPCVIVSGSCPSDCSAAAKPPGLPPSSQK